MNRPLNFLHLTTFYPPYSFGGDAMYIYRLAHVLGDAGLDALRALDPATLPAVDGDPRMGACVGSIGKCVSPLR